MELGGLACRVVGGSDRQGGGDGPLVILLHGFGAPGDDLVSLWRVLAAPSGTRFVFPAAPLAIDVGYGAMFDSRAWWMIDMARLERALITGEARDLTRDVPEGLAPARAKLIALLEDCEQKLGADPAKTVLGGFSQGAMLSLDVALHTDRPLAGLVLMSGTLLAEDEWIPRMPSRKGLPVFQSHGTNDPLLPFTIAERLRDLLVQNGLRVTFTPFRGAHEIPAPVLDGVGTFLQATL